MFGIYDEHSKHRKNKCSWLVKTKIWLSLTIPFDTLKTLKTVEKQGEMQCQKWYYKVNYKISCNKL